MAVYHFPLCILALVLLPVDPLLLIFYCIAVCTVLFALSFTAWAGIDGGVSTFSVLFLFFTLDCCSSRMLSPLFGKIDMPLLGALECVLHSVQLYDMGLCF